MAALYTSNSKPDSLKADAYIIYMMVGSYFASCKCDNAILEKRLLIAESSKFVPYDIKEQMREFYDSYVEELDRRVDSGELTTMELEDIDEQVDLQIEKEEREKKGL